MALFMVSKILENGNIKGYRILNSRNGQITDIEKEDLGRRLLLQEVHIENLRSKGKSLEIEGYNGSIDRYGEVNGKQSLVILKAYRDNKDNLVGFLASDSQGNVRRLSLNTAISIAENYGIANGKIVDRDGKKIISAIEGTYDYEIVQMKNEKEQNKEKDYMDEDLAIKIKDLVVHPEYNKLTDSVLDNTINNIRRLRRATRDDKEIIEDRHKKWFRGNNEKPANINGKYELIYRKMRNGELYVTGIEPKNFDGVVIIPETHGGERVTGISYMAFSGSSIKAIRMTSAIKDIGQSAFNKCENLQAVDMDKASNEHIATNTFKGCTALRLLAIGGKVKRLHENSFRDCKSLEKVVLPSSVETIAKSAFEGCTELKEVTNSGGLKYINEAAFQFCYKLDTIDLNGVISIGARAFASTNFSELTIPSTVNTIGARAFINCDILEKVVIEEGVEEIGEECFYSLQHTRNKEKHINTVTTPKSLITFGNRCFHNVKVVEVYTGSAAESHCIGFNQDIRYLDKVDKDNSTRTRMASQLFDSNIIKMVYDELQSSHTEEDYPGKDLEINKGKLISFKLNDQVKELFKLDYDNIHKEPSVKFKAALNYLTDTTDLYLLPMENRVVRLMGTFDVIAEPLYNDRCNCIYKMSYVVKDTLETGTFIMVIMDGTLVYLCEYSDKTNMIMENKDNHLEVVSTKYLHAGDTIGKESVISGKEAVYRPPGYPRDVNVGNELLKRYMEHGILFKSGVKNRYLYLPEENKVLRLFDGRSWDRHGKIRRETPDCLGVIEIMDYDDFIKSVNKLIKTSNKDKQLFETLGNAPDEYVDYRLKTINYVEEEKIGQLYYVAQTFKSRIQGKSKDEVVPEDLSLNALEGLSKSYWLVEKDVDWFESTGNKSLNKMNEYTIENRKIIEYKSNQVVQFANPYMKGKKGAFVFAVHNGKYIESVYASRISLGEIVRNLWELLNIPSDVNGPELMTDPYKLERLDSRLFYKFFDVLYSKEGWSLPGIGGMKNYGAWYSIDMYKPTGVFYVTMSIITKEKRASKVKGKKADVIVQVQKVIPLFKVGNMDRALIVADTTNSKARDSKLLSELNSLMIAERLNIAKGGGKYRSNYFELKSVYDNYCKARELTIKGETNAEHYKDLIDDRLVYMIGTKAKGEIQVAGSSRFLVSEFEGLDVEIDDSLDIDETEEYEIDIEDEDEEYIDFGDVDDEYEIDDDEYEIDDDEYEIDDDIISKDNLSKTLRRLKEGLVGEKEAAQIYKKLRELAGD